MVKIKNSSENEHDYLQEGIAYNNARMYNLAIKSFNNAISSNIESQLLYNELGLAYFNESLLPEAKEAFKKAITPSKTNTKGFVGLPTYIAYTFTNETADFKPAIEVIFPVGNIIV